MAAATEARINALAARQHGVVTRAQLLEAGLTERMIAVRLRQQRLRPLHRGVYLAAPLASPQARHLAAVFACGPGTVISHASAVALWGLLRHVRLTKEIEVTVPDGHRGRRPGIRARRSWRLDASDVTQHDGIPITTVARTLLDLAGDVARNAPRTARSRMLEQAVAHAERTTQTSRAELLALIRRHARRAGVRLLRTIVEDRGGPTFTRSEAEERTLALLRKGGMPQPQVNAIVAGYEVDFHWPAERLILEVDGYAFHSAQSRFEGDRQRDAQLSAAGYRVIRVTWRQITRQPEAVLVRIALTLGRASVRPQPPTSTPDDIDA